MMFQSVLPADRHAWLKLMAIPILGGILYTQLPVQFFGDVSSNVLVSPTAPSTAQSNETVSLSNLKSIPPEADIIANSALSSLSTSASSQRSFPTVPNPNGNGERRVLRNYDPKSLAQLQPFDRSRLTGELESGVFNGSGSKLVSAGADGNNKAIESVSIQAIYRSSQGISAMVGDQWVRVGDALPDGSRVVSITAKELILAPPEVN